MAKQKMTFEQNLDKLEIIVKKLEDGNIPLDESLNDFKKGVVLKNSLKKQLDNAQNTVTKMKKDDGSTVPLPNNQTKAPAESSTKESASTKTTTKSSSKPSDYAKASSNVKRSKPITSQSNKSATVTKAKPLSSTNETTTKASSSVKSDTSKSNNNSEAPQSSSSDSNKQVNQANDLFHQMNENSKKNGKHTNSPDSNDSLPF